MFSDGTSVDQLAEDLKTGKINPNDVPSIRLVEKDGELYTLDNRRLYAFQKAGVDVNHKIVNLKDVVDEMWKFTTKNGGTSIKVRGR